MTEEKNEQIQSEEEELELPEVAEGEEDTIDWKELALKQQGINKRQKTKIEKMKVKEKKPKEPEKKPEKPEEKPSEFDYGQKTFINQVLKIDLDDEKQTELVKGYIANGKTLDELKGNKYFRNDLKDIKDAKKAENAIPTSTNRSSSSDTSAVDYWLTKPFNEVPESIKRKVLNAELKKDKKKSMFGK